MGTLINGNIQIYSLTQMNYIKYYQNNIAATCFGFHEDIFRVQVKSGLIYNCQHQ